MALRLERNVYLTLGYWLPLCIRRELLSITRLLFTQQKRRESRRTFLFTEASGSQITPSTTRVSLTVG